MRKKKIKYIYKLINFFIFFIYMISFFFLFLDYFEIVLFLFFLCMFIINVENLDQINNEIFSIGFYNR
jgi:hypothetical protein